MRTRVAAALVALFVGEWAFVTPNLLVQKLGGSASAG
jgi:hypothetical protein